MTAPNDTASAVDLPAGSSEVQRALDALPMGPWRVSADEPSRVLDADDHLVFIASPEVAAQLTDLRNASAAMVRHNHALRSIIAGFSRGERPDALKAHDRHSFAPSPSPPTDTPTPQPMRKYETPESVMPFLPEGAVMPTLPTYGSMLTFHVKREKERLADPEGFARRETEATARRVAYEAQRDAAQKEEEHRQWIDRALRRGCPAHRPTMDAVIKPAETPALSAVRAALKWFAERTDGPISQAAVLVLSGRNGAGKSVAAARAVAARRGGVSDARFIVADAIASLPDNDWSEYLRARDELVAVPLLAIDECGVEVARAAGLRVSAILRKRYDAGRLTIVTTNLTRPQFVARYLCTRDGEGKTVPDERFVSRLDREQSSAGLSPWFDVPAEDRRGTK